jgi:hypothetical protein
MSKAIISFQREFQIWLYSVSHGQLLLRSNRSERVSTRIDVLFKNVAAVSLPTLFEGLSLAEATTDEARDLNIQLGALPIQKRKVFAIWGANFRGYVVAGAIFWHEDEGYHFDTSYFEGSLNPRLVGATRLISCIRSGRRGRDVSC